MSSQVLSNLNLSMPFTSNRASKPLRSPASSSRFCVNAMAPDGSRNSNLDHLQRTNISSNKQQQPRRKVASSAPIGLWDRFPTARTVQQMMDTMERLVEDDPFAYSTSLQQHQPLMSDETRGSRNYRTPWEIKEGEGEYKLRFDIPGMTKQDVKIWVEEKMLVVKGEKKKNKEGEEEEEWRYGKYGFRIALPENVEFEKIKAEVRDGVLYLSIPKASIKAKVFDISVD